MKAKIERGERKVGGRQQTAMWLRYPPTTASQELHIYKGTRTLLVVVSHSATLVLLVSSLLTVN